MRALIQRVSKAKVIVGDRTLGNIGSGILVFLGIGENDDQQDINYLFEKITQLRIFGNKSGKMDLSLKDIDGQLLLVSQFTLYGNIKKGRRPDFTKAANPELAKKLYNAFIEKCKNQNIKIQTGEFAAKMDVMLVNDGPVTFFIDSREKSVNI